MLYRRLLFAALLLLAAPVTVADAQGPLEHRVDIVGPSVGVGHLLAPTVDYGEEIVLAHVEVRYAHGSGSGMLVRGGYGSNGWGEGYGGELDYLHRFLLVGDADVSLGIDLTLGLTAAGLDHTDERFPAGFHAGGNAGVSLDARFFNFMISLGAQYRLLAPEESAPNGGPTGLLSLWSATLGFGVSIY